MKIDIKVAINLLRSFNAPAEVIDAFVKLAPEGYIKEAMTAEERSDAQLDAVTTFLAAYIRDEGEDALANSHIIPRATLQRRFLSNSLFRGDPIGGNAALNNVIGVLILNNKLAEVSLAELRDTYRFNGVAFDIRGI